MIHPARVDDFEEVNARGTANVMTAARAAGVRRVVHVSSNSPFGVNALPRDTFRNDEPYDPYLGYGRSKMRAELHVLGAVDRGLERGHRAPALVLRSLPARPPDEVLRRWSGRGASR